MSSAFFAIPVEAAMPVVRPFLTAVGVAFTVARPLIGLGIIAALMWMFKPLLRGLARASLMLFNPRQSLAQRAEKRTLRGVVMLNRMARELDTQQPNLAAELRLLAARG